MTTTASTATSFGAIRKVDESTTVQDQASSADLENTYQAQLDEVNKYFYTHTTKSVAWRLRQLRALKKVWIRREKDVIDAISKDLGRPEVMTYVFEFSNVLNEINLMLKKTSKWAKPYTVGSGLITYPSKTKVQYEPKGTILCIGPWNFPFVLTLIPLVNMIAAGNCCVMKPSEVSVHSSALLTEIIEEALDPKAFRVINGAVKETTALLKLKWDHIMYTGNGMVGRIVMRAAAEHLTPVTLELGGKSPVYIDENVDLQLVASRMAFSKIACTGQICIAPDYLMVHRRVFERFTKLYVAELSKLMGGKEGQADYSEIGHIINERHFDRVASLAENHGGEVLWGGKEYANREKLYFPLTLIKNPSFNSKVMREEIFGPVLPMFPVKDHKEAVEFINKREKPLALYIHSNSQHIVDAILKTTSSGAVTVNDCLYHAASQTIPFGGIGPSGMGAYKGFDGFVEFSHKRGVMKRGKLNLEKFQPYSKNESFLKKVIAWAVKRGIA